MSPTHAAHLRGRRTPLRPELSGRAKQPARGAVPRSRAPGLSESTVRLAVPDEGIRDGDLVLRPLREEDVDAVVLAFSDPEIREAGNLPNLSRDELLESLPHLPSLAARGRLLPLVATDVTSGRILGSGVLHHLDADRGIVEIGYWLFADARGRGVATRVVRLLAEHAFSLGVKRVAAYVNVGNEPSDRVLGRAGFTREGVVRSLPKPNGTTRVDKTLYSLLPGE